jgi:anti-sigma B factor antagonist
MADPAGGAVRTLVDDGVAYVVLSGDIDLASGDLVSEGIAAALEEHRGVVVLDLSGVTFLDSYGLRALMAARVEAEQTGRPLRIVEASKAARHAITLAGAAALFGLEP